MWMQAGFQDHCRAILQLRHCFTAWKSQLLWHLGRKIPQIFKNLNIFLWALLEKILCKGANGIFGCSDVSFSNIQHIQPPTLQLPHAKTHAFTLPAAANISTKLPLLQQLCHHPEYRRGPMGEGLLPINFPPIIMTPREKNKTENSSLRRVSCQCFSITSGH